ncbi:hypothetical protein, partial [Halomonas sp. ALS9]|uniref:hypothetical protein n=1 Tax=Halomonas sp. ALS9 TaxID=1805819 RepID=UPI000A9A3371
LAITLNGGACILPDAPGRGITFGALAPGQARFSPTEQLWIRRGGASTDEESNAPRWQALDETLRSDSERIVLSQQRRWPPRVQAQAITQGITLLAGL